MLSVLVSPHSSVNYTGWRRRSGLTTSWLSWSTSVDKVPPYFADELCQPADTEARCRLRSASASSLIVRCTRLSTVGDRAFSVAAPRIWNSLPQHVTSAPSLAIFRSRLKTHLFRRCFPWLHRSLVVPEKWHVITDTLIVLLLTYFSYTALFTGCVEAD